MHILLLQARRQDDPAKEEELAAFAGKAGLPLSAFVPHDLLQGPPSLETIRRYDALMIGGSGEFNVSDRSLPHFLETLDLLAEVVEIGYPTFASCFGFQLLTAALGGEIVRDAANTEVGAYETFLSEAGRADELFGYLPDVFCAQYGHKEHAVRLPGPALNLASTTCCRYQAMRIPGKPIWATQFHPELSGDENRLRFTRYAKIYVGVLGKEEYERRLAGFKPSPETEELIPRFLQLIG